MKRHWAALAVLTFLATGCGDDDDQANTAVPPAVQTAGQPDPNQPGQPPQPSTGTTTNPPPSGSLPLNIYTDELHQGGAFLYPGGENQTLSFNDTSDPANGANSIRYSWNGGNVAGQNIFAGMDLIHSGSLSDYVSTAARNLQEGRYTRVTFNAKGTLGQDVVLKIEAADDGVPGSPAPCLVLSNSGLLDDSTPGNPVPSCTNRGMLTNSWQSFSIAVTPADLQAVKDFFKSTFIYRGNPASFGTGGTVFFDQIQYQS